MYIFLSTSLIIVLAVDIFKRNVLVSARETGNKIFIIRQRLFYLKSDTRKRSGTRNRQKRNLRRKNVAWNQIRGAITKTVKSMSYFLELVAKNKKKLGIEKQPPASGAQNKELEQLQRRQKFCASKIPEEDLICERSGVWRMKTRRCGYFFKPLEIVKALKNFFRSTLPKFIGIFWALVKSLNLHFLTECPAEPQSIYFSIPAVIFII